MGIHGLTSFIDNNPHLLKDRQLHNCRVVIDGNNFYHFLYFYCNVRFQFGGDFDIFQRKIHMIFSLFKSCNIEVFVVFDGAYTIDGKKHKTTLSRAKDRVYASQRIMNGRRGVLIPCLAKHTFKQALDKLGIPHVTCDFEADNQLVTLANQWNCPVISNDSDFYIFDLSGGFIPLDYIDFRLHKMTQESSTDGTVGTFLLVQYYHVDEFIKCFKSLNRSVLPLFATMLGNDYVNAAAFEAFYQKTPKVASRRYTASQKHHKIVSVLYWLEEHQQEGELVSQVLSFIHPERRQHVQKLLSSSISGYLDTQAFESFDLKAFLEGKQTAASQNTDQVISSTGKCLAPWFVTACRSGKMPVFLLNAVLLHRVVLPTQVESRSLPASFTTSRPIREVTYGLLLGGQDSPPASSTIQRPDSPKQTPSEPSPAKIKREDDKDLQKKQAERTEENSEFERGTEVPGSVSGDRRMKTPEPGTSPSVVVVGVDNSVVEKSKSGAVDSSAGKETKEGVVEYTRHNLELWRVAVPLRVTLLTSGNLPPLKDVPALGKDERLAILRETLGVSAPFVSRFDASLQLYMMCLAFWAKNAVPAVSPHLLKGIVLSAVLLHIHKEIAEREKQVLAESAEERQAFPSGNATSSSPLSQASDKPYDHAKSSDPYQTMQENKSAEDVTLSITGTCCSRNSKVQGKVRENLKKYYHNPTQISSKNPPVPELFHGIAQFLACLLDAVHLNSLLRCPLSVPQPAEFFNGSFVYTMAHELQQRSNPDSFLSEMLVRGSPLLELFDALCDEVVRETGEVFVEKQPQGKKLCKGAKKKKKQQAAGCGKEGGMDRGGCEDTEKTGEAGEVFHDLNNRFGALLMDDSS